MKRFKPEEIIGKLREAEVLLGQGASVGKLLSPARRRRAVEHVFEELGVSERRSCRVLGQHRSTQRHRPVVRGDEEALTRRIVKLACQYGRYGYRLTTGLLRTYTVG